MEQVINHNASQLKGFEDDSNGEPKQPHYPLQENQSFEDLMFRLSTDSAHLTDEKMEVGIFEVLQKMAIFLQVERSFIVLTNHLSKQLEVKYEWHSEHIGGICRELLQVKFDWNESFYQILLQEQFIHFSNIEVMPEDCASLKTQFLNCKIVGFSATAIFLQNKFAGFLGFATSKTDYSLSVEGANRIKIMGNVLSNLLIRQQTYQQLNSFTHNLRQLHQLTTTSYPSFEEQFKAYLETGRQIFDMETGVVSRVTKDVYRIESVVTDWLGIKVGMEFPCSWMYCSKVINEKRTIFYDCIGDIPEMQNHPGYKRLPIESYIGAPIFVNNEVYGTLNFTRKKPRPQAFVKQDKEIIEMMAQGIGKLLETQLIEMDRAETLQELKTNKARYQAILENQTEFICRFLPTGKPTFLNQTFLDYLAEHQIDLIDFNFESFMRNETQAFAEILKGLSIENPFVTYVHHWVLPDDSVKWERWNCKAIFDNQYELIEYQAVGQDITDQKIAELSLEKTNTYLEEIAINLKRSNEDLRQFAYAASHDLQEPIRMISSYLQLIERRYKNQLDAEALEFIDFAVSGAKRMQVLINDLLAYSRVNTQQKPMTENDLNAILGIVLHTLDAKIKETGAFIQINDLPKVYIDASQFIRLFQNLLENALKFKKPDSSPVIHVFAEDKGTYWQFGVRDNGIGIDPEFAHKIFVIFQRLHTRQEYPGTGIGLAVCKKIVERHNGEIWVESEVGEGTVFYFTLSK